MNKKYSQVYDCAIIGGGLAGLSLAILLAKQQKRVIVFEKEIYPTHKVCGEYISMESWPFLRELGIPLQDLQLPRINQLYVSTPSGYQLSHTLSPGGFGISRYFLDNLLYQLALANGVEVHHSYKVTSVEKEAVMYTVVTENESVQAKLVTGAWGKRSNIDLTWQRDFAMKQKSGLANYMGVKYHLKRDFPQNRIELHNFLDGYAGISKVEGDRYCLCYLTTAATLKKYGSIEEMERAVLWKNPHLKEYLSRSEMLYERPLAISQISFLPKKQAENGVLMIGDAAGLISPLCGNGMSMAFHSAKILAVCLERYFKQELSFEELTTLYTVKWRDTFSGRLLAGRVIQRLFGSTWTTEVFIRSLTPFPAVVKKLVDLTHGNEF